MDEKFGYIRVILVISIQMVFSRITDRKKNIIIPAGGKNVAPQQIESQLKSIDGISQAVVIGDKRRYLIAILTVDAERADMLATTANSWTAGALADQPEFEITFRLNWTSSMTGSPVMASRSNTFICWKTSSPSKRELTPTQKVKRRAVELKYAAEIDALYAW